MVSNRDFARFLAWTVITIVIGILLSIAIVVVIDPYRLYRLIEAPHFNQIKPQPDRYQEEIKLTGARAMKANVFIMGNSRAEIGLNPDYAGFSNGGFSAYNLAISGTSISTATRELDYLRNAGQKPAMVVLGVDFLDFLTDPNFRQASEAAPKSAHAVDGSKWKFDAIFSLTSTLDAVKTLQIQRASEAETITSRGFNPLLEYKKYARTEGYYALFQQRAGEYAKTFVRKPHGLIHSETGSSPDLDEFRKILSVASRDETELHLIIYPYHAQVLAMFEQAGLWSAFEQWKGLLAEEVATIKKEHPLSRITLWDFSGFSRLQCERIPAKGDLGTSTQWYWEAGHFKPAFGERIFARVLGQGKESLLTHDIGFPLTPSNVVENQKRIAGERAECMASYPELFRDVSKLIDASRSTAN